MPARSTSTRTIRRAAIGALALAAGLLLQTPAAAQDRSLIPADIKVAGDGTSAALTWSAVPVDGVTYRIVRRAETEKTGIDLTKPVSETFFVDAAVTAGLTYFYQVIAVFRDGTSASADPVTFVAPVVASQPIVAKEVPRLPTAVTGITVQGTLKSAEVRWQSVTGALSYSVKRSLGDLLKKTTSGITTTKWVDNGPTGDGFAMAGTYIYDVTATLSGGTTVSGQGTWTRPDPVCTAPPADQAMIALLNPPAVTWIGQIPEVSGFFWPQNKSSLIVAYRVERSLQGTNLWTLLATSCDGTLGASSTDYMFLDRSARAPNTTYLYKLTGIGASGQAGAATLPYTSPNPSAMHWLSQTISGNTVTMAFRYEAPSTNAPQLPSANFYVTAPYGLNQLVAVPNLGHSGTPGSACWTASGCSFVVTGVPSGTHTFTVTASWISGPIVLAKISANTTVVIQ
jgi:fibronectin type 3 domain-containing protein